MPVYLVERILPGMSMQTLERLRRRVEDECRRATLVGRPIRYFRSTLTPGESRCRCLFEAPGEDQVRSVNDAAGFPYERIMLALDLIVDCSFDPSSQA